MNFSIRLFLYFVVVLLGFHIFPMTVPASGLSSKIDELFHAWDNENSPGCAIAVIKDGQTIFENGYGMANLKYGIPNTPERIYRFASNSKQFTAFSIFLLEEDGLLSTDDDLRLHIPEFPDFGYTITLQHLIDHTSGLRDHLELMAFAGWNMLEDLVTVQHGLNIVKRMTDLNFIPGDRFMYSNTGFMLLAEIVSRVSGKSFVDFTQERIFTPLEMNDTQFVDNQRLIVENMSDAYYTIPDDASYYFPMNFASVGEAGLHSTVRDIVKWDQNFYDAKVGSSIILEKMHRNGVLNDGQLSPFSAGLIVTEYKGKKLVYHGGDLGGYHSQIVRFPDERFSIVTASNTFDLNSNVLLEKSLIAADYYFEYPSETSIPDFRLHEPSLHGWGLGEKSWYAPDLRFQQFWNDLYNSNRKEIKPKAKTVSPQMTAEQASQYEGLYYSPELDSFMAVSYDGTENLLFQTNRNSLPYMFSVKNVRSDRIFVNETNELKGDFIRNSDGEVVGFKISNSRIVDLEFRKAEIVTEN